MNRDKIRSFLIRFYAWVSAVFFGGILLDIVYAQNVNLILDVSKSTFVSSEAADFLLLVGFVTILAAIATITSAWKFKAARNLLLASLFIIIFEFLAPALFSRLLPGQNVGPWLRILLSGSSSALAFAGLHLYYRQK
jgi:hypothetical protein